METLVVFSHLRWNFVYQRPQHLLSRLAQRWRVVFIEEPLPGADENRLERIAPCHGVQVWRPHVRGEAPGFHDDHLPALHRLVTEAMREERVTDYWIWYYTPMAYPVASVLSPRGVVYDCMDELSAFKNAPRQLLQRENALFKAADLVFTGGPSLYNAKRSRHPSVHCFASSVDALHFSQAANDHPLQAGLPGPRIGWAGVIDERVNLDLVAAVADARPDWQLVMVGPIVKIDPASTPKRPNLHWLGQQSYDDLPEFISGWDVCMLPFALNEATRYISPTKILEYMACGRPSVSTSIRDVVEPYGHCVAIADTPEAFVAACEEILARDEPQRAAHVRVLSEVVARTSWDKTVHAMASLIEEVEARRMPDEAEIEQPSVAVQGQRALAV
ncbi:glycosyltransferase [Ramlibacter sp. AN1015]|uniref:glycosyltransferase n=1 Tax=Ramlibacter sp. AN1015 TaxID=3133428 RepID=UPI0030C21782